MSGAIPLLLLYAYKTWTRKLPEFLYRYMKIYVTNLIFLNFQNPDTVCAPLGKLPLNRLREPLRFVSIIRSLWCPTFYKVNEMHGEYRTGLEQQPTPSVFLD